MTQLRPSAPRIVLTGGAGRIARLVRPILRLQGFRITLIDRESINDLTEHERFFALDINDVEGLADVFTGNTLVVHLAGLSAEAPWADIVTANVDGTRNVLEACRISGVGRALLGSSSHVIGMRTVADIRNGDLGVQPDTYYGVSKAALEAIGALYAGRFGLLVVSVRIGTVSERPADARQLSTWMSPADFVRLIVAVAGTPATGAHVIWGTSLNARRLFPLGPGEWLGFRPQDDSEVFAPDLGDPPELAEETLLGGRFAQDDHPVGECW